jgi:hypothetical protein
MLWEYDALAFPKATSKSAAVKDAPASLILCCSLLWLGALLDNCQITKICYWGETIHCSHDPFDRNKAGALNEINKVRCD